VSNFNLIAQFRGASPNIEYSSYGAIIGLGLGLLMLGAYYQTDLKGKEIRRANIRLSDTANGLMKNSKVNIDINIGTSIKLQSDFYDFKKMTEIVSTIPDLEIPYHYICPIYQTIMISPVTLLDGNSYEKEALQRWYDSGKNTCPLDPSKKLENPRLLPINETLSKAIKHYVETSYKKINSSSSIDHSYS
jgi:hypothetical protein